jgi:hypothetical protein
MKPKQPPPPVNQIWLIAQLASVVSVAAFFYYLRHDGLLLYGDAVAHINIARRVFDSRTPGLLQLGTVWLPLPHLLMLPFLVSRFLWQTGIGGAIPSMIAYVLSVAGIFRLVRTVIGGASTEGNVGASVTAWLAAGIFALNPNLIYLQTTAMTEPIYLAFFVWALVFFFAALRSCTIEGIKSGSSALVNSGLCVAGASLTRYDGWFLATTMSAVLIALSFSQDFAPLRSGLKKFILLAAAAPVFWIAYNAVVYRNPLEFANGPYSAKAIEQKTAVPGMPPHPGSHDLRVAFQYFFKAAEFNFAPGKWQLFWVAALLLGTVIVLLFQRKLWPLLFLWLPVPFYMLSIAYSGVPIFVPTWWPFSRYNVRYGIEMLPAFAVFSAAASYGLIRFAASRRSRLAIAGVFCVVPAVSYGLVWAEQPVSFQEAVINSRSRIALEKALARDLQLFPPESTYLMYLGDHVGAFQRAGIPLSHVINEGNHRPWKHPSDPDGLWERALAHPAAYANFVIAFGSDAVATAVNNSELSTVLVLRVSGQPQATIYQTTKSNQPR